MPVDTGLSANRPLAVVDADLLLLDRDRDDQRPMRLGVGFLEGGPGLGGRPAGLRLARLRHRCRPVVAGIGVLPVEQGGSICLGGGNQGAGRRQHRHLPKSPFGIGCARNTRTEKPMPAHALDPQIRLLESTLPIIICCRRGENAFTSVGLLISAIFAPIVAKKPHIPLNGGPDRAPRPAPAGRRSSCAAFRHYIGGEPFSGDINDIQGHR